MLKSPAQLADEARSEIPEIDVAQLRKDLDSGKLPYVLIDVREPEESATGTIPGAVPIPRGTLELHAAKVAPDENTAIVCYCGGGTRSLLAGQQLKRMGYANVRSLAGGMKAWRTGGNPLK